MKPPTEGPKTGVVTFLDVLGWKGVYDRKQDAISSLTVLIEGVRKLAERKQRGRTMNPIEVRSISDTIGIFTHASGTNSEISDIIDIHGEICQWLIPESIASEIPVRGAISFGEFQIFDQIFVGKAIDEAASWHEQSDWIGVHLTPSAEFVYVPSPGSKTWLKYSPPHKTKINWEPNCVNWVSGWDDPQREEEAIKDKFRRLGPIVPEIAGKFVNTLAFTKAATKTPANADEPAPGDSEIPEEETELEQAEA